MTRRLRVRIGVALALAVWLAGCAPHRIAPPELDLARDQRRFLDRLDERERRGAAVDADMSVWLERQDGEALPGVQARLQLGGPDAFRLRVGSVFGTALDLSAFGDSLTAYVPARRVGIELDAAVDSLGVRAPGGLGYRALTAAWRPAEGAWAGATRAESLLVVRWPEDGDTVRVEIGSSGLPTAATVARPGHGEVQVLYESWDGASGVMWPKRLVVRDGRGMFRLTCRIDRVRFAARADRSQIAVRLPPGTDRWTRAELMRLIDRIGGM